MEVSGQLQAPTALIPRNESSVHNKQETRLAPGLVWTLRRIKNILPLMGIELRLLSRPARSLIAIPI
jgi:hypothetical protein